MMEVEAPATKVNKEALKAGKKESENSLLGKFVSKKDVSIQNYKPTMLHSWTCTNSPIVRLQRNVYLLFFPNVE